MKKNRNLPPALRERKNPRLTRSFFKLKSGLQYVQLRPLDTRVAASPEIDAYRIPADVMQTASEIKKNARSSSVTAWISRSFEVAAPGQRIDSPFTAYVSLTFKEPVGKFKKGREDRAVQRTTWPAWGHPFYHPRRMGVGLQRHSLTRGAAKNSASRKSARKTASIYPWPTEPKLAATRNGF